MKLSTFIVVLSAASSVHGSRDMSGIRGMKTAVTEPRKLKKSASGVAGSLELPTEGLVFTKKNGKSSSSDEEAGAGTFPTLSPSLSLGPNNFRPSSLPSLVPSLVEDDVVEGSGEVPTLGPSLVPSELPSDLPSDEPSSVEGRRQRKLYDELDLFGYDPDDFRPPEDAEDAVPTLAPSSSPAPSGSGPSDAPSQQPSNGEEGRKLYDNLELFGEDPDAFKPPEDAEDAVPTLAPSSSPEPSGGPSSAPSNGEDGRRMNEMLLH